MEMESDYIPVYSSVFSDLSKAGQFTIQLNRWSWTMHLSLVSLEMILPAHTDLFKTHIQYADSLQRIHLRKLPKQPYLSLNNDYFPCFP